MKKLVYSALALSLTGAPGFASEDTWSQLDQEVEALTSSLSLQGSGPSFSGWMASRYANSSDVDVNGNDLGGFMLTDVRLIIAGSHGEFGYFANYNLVTSDLLDGFATFPIGGSINGKLGMFKQPITASGLMDGDKRFFIDRNAAAGGLGGDPGADNIAGTSGRDTGLQLSGELDTVNWWVGVANGEDAKGDELLVTGRVTLDVAGDGNDASVGGAWGGSDAIGATVGASFFDDGNVTDGSGFAVDVYASTNVYSVGAEFLSFDDGLPGAFSNTLIEADSSPFSLQGTYMISPETWEVGVRFQDLDDTDDTQIIDIGVNRYLDGPGLRWLINLTQLESDSGDVDLVQAGLVLTF